MHLIEEHQIPNLIDGEWDYAYTGPDDHPILNNLDRARLARNVSLHELNHVVKILLLPRSPSEMDILTAELSILHLNVYPHHREQIIDINPGGISKWSALQCLGIEENDYIAFGNDANDLIMLQKARYAIRIGITSRWPHMRKRRSSWKETTNR